MGWPALPGVLASPETPPDGMAPWLFHRHPGWAGAASSCLRSAAAVVIFPCMSELKHILSAIEQGDPSAAAQLLPLVYDELRQLAAQKLAQEKPGQTLQATALVHEAYLRLVDTERARHWNGRTHFFRAAAEAMRRILIETARRK